MAADMFVNEEDGSLAVSERKYRNDDGERDVPVQKMAEHMLGLTKFYELAERYWAAGKTSNSLERLFKEIKRRTKSVGRFPNARSCNRWMFALITRGYTPDYGGKRTALTEFTHNA
jgi:transposase-like protein